MVIAVRCKVCSNADTRRMVELGWNAKMNAVDISHGLEAAIGPTAILKHLKEHSESGMNREIPVEQAVPLRDRVYAIQKLQIEEIERRVALAQQKASEMSELSGQHHDWSEFFDVLDKDMQQAVGSILKAQAGQDKHESTKAGLKIDLFRALSAHGKAPTALIGDGIIEGEAVEVEDE